MPAWPRRASNELTTRLGVLPLDAGYKTSHALLFDAAFGHETEETTMVARPISTSLWAKFWAISVGHAACLLRWATSSACTRRSMSRAR
jgi:hypothetical protein